MKIAFLGGGNMATALIGGLLAKGFAAASLHVVEPLEGSRQGLAETFGVRCSAAVDDEALASDTWVLAVKPQQMRTALAPLAGKLKDQLVISIAAGLRLDDVGRWLGGHHRLVRTMPNTPALIGAGMTGLYAAPAVDAAGRDRAELVLRAVGDTVWLDDEAMMDAVTAVSGSGPAYVFYFIEALEAAAREFGFDPAAARRLAVGTVLGAARLAAAGDEPVAILRERVTSKGGTTEAALQSFAGDRIAEAIGRGIRAAAQRSCELGEQMGKS